MASRNIEDLLPEVGKKARRIQKACREKYGFDLLIYCTLRTLEEQARLFRQSRTRREINLKIQNLQKRGFEFLAEIIAKVGPCSGPHVTNAAPGESWHNYAEAWDGVPLIAGKPAWNYNSAKPQWSAYGAAVRDAGMHWAGDWRRFKEYPHAQLHATGNALTNRRPGEVKAVLKKIGLLYPCTKTP